MPFDFGGANNNPAPGGGFGGTPAPTPATPGFGAAAPASSGGAPAPAFNFGSTNPVGTAPTAAAASNAPVPPAGGAAPPVFGSNAPVAGGPASAPTGSGPSFGAPSGGSTTPAPAATAPTTAGFNFGGVTPAGSAAPAASGGTTNTPAASAPAGSGFNFSSTSTPAPALGTTSASAPLGGGFLGSTTAATTTPGAATGPTLVAVPKYEDIFPGFVLWKKIQHLSQRAIGGDDFSGQELLHLLSVNANTNDSSPLSSLGSMLLQADQIWRNNRNANNSLRQQLSQQKEVLVRGNKATLNDHMLREVIQIAESLFITETEALSLFAKARENPASQSDIFSFAQSLYFQERSQYMKSLLFLIQNRLEAKDGSYFLHATDGLLQNGLVKNLLSQIQNYSRRIHELGTHISDLEKRASTSSTFSVMSISTSSSSATDQHKQVASMHWHFGKQERQRAAECLFFVAYSTQMEVAEITALVDAVQFLTDPSQGWPGMPVLHPFDDAPSAYEPIDPSATTSHSFPPFTTISRREKDPLKWQQELVALCVSSGRVALLRCVSTLVLTGIASLSAHHVLLDRETHASSSLGTGNALIPEDASASLGHLDPILNKLNLREASKWHRADVFGLFLASFWLLLKEAPQNLVSPRASATVPSGSSWSPSEIRRGLRENLEAPAELRSFTFGRLAFVPALAIPIKESPFQNCVFEEFAWDVLAGFSRQYFDVLTAQPPISRLKWEEDAEEDRRLREQSRDQYREFQRWSGTTTTRTEEVPSAINLLERPDCMDDVLAFFSFIASKAPEIAFWFWNVGGGGDFLVPDSISNLDKIRRNDKSLRSVVFAMLSGLATAEDPAQPGNFKGASKLHLLLSPKDIYDEDVIHLRYEEILHVVRDYTRDLVGKGNFRSSGQTTSSSGHQTTSYYYFNDGDRGTSSSQTSKKSSTSPKPELGEGGTRLLVAVLCLIEAIATRSADARTFLRDLSLEVQSSDGLVGRDSTLLILSTLATTPVPPEVRGCAFSAIAAIIQDSVEEAQKAWEIVESSSFLPIYKLQQFPTAIGENEAPSIGFPPSSTARVNEKQRTSWIPPNQSFSIIYEMEYVESAVGSYPSTTGFLRLLTSLATNGGCPSTLGQNWRSRPGCAPYIEYAMDLVLPRATGTFGGLPPLPFRSTLEKHRLCDAALELIKVVACIYLVPQAFAADEDKMIADSFSSSRKTALKTLNAKSLSERVTELPKKEDFRSFLGDFRPGSSIASGFQTSTLPSPKSAGFTVLVDILRNDRNSFFSTLSSVLADDNTATLSAEIDDLRMSWSLFLNLRPSFKNSKKDRPQQSSRLSKLLVGLDNEEELCDSRANEYKANVFSKALQIFCTVASKEESFHSAVVSAGIDRMVPILRFSTQQTSPIVWSFNFSPIRAKIESSTVIASFPNLIAVFGRNIDVAYIASVLLFYMKGCADLPRFSDGLSRALMQMIPYLAARSPGCQEAADLLSFLFVELLKELRTEQPSPIVDAVLCQRVVEAIGASISLQTLNLAERSRKIAPLGYEAMFRANRKLGMPKFLSDVFVDSFYNLRQYVAGAVSGDYPKEVFLSTAWVLKGIADQLNDSSTAAGARFFAGAAPVDEKTRLLQGSIVELFRVLPDDRNGYSATLSEGLHLALGAILSSASMAPAKVDVIDVVATILDKLTSDFDDATWRNVALSLFLAVEHAELPPVPAVDLSWGLCKTIANVSSARGIFVATLIITLRNLGTNISVDDADGMLALVSDTLVGMCCQVTEDFPTRPTDEALTARSALKLLWTVASDSAVHRELMKGTTFGMKATALDKMISLVGNLDADICSLLSLISVLSLGSDQLVKAGVLNQLEHGGILFREYVQTSQDQNFAAAGIDTPTFLFDHLKLLSCVLLNVSESLRPDVALHVHRILSLYDPVLPKMLSAFPLDGNTLAEYVRCFAVATQLLPLGADAVSEVALASLPPFVFQLTENPLPKACLGPVPRNLLAPSVGATAALMYAEVANKSWWDVLKIENPNMQTEELCSFGVSATEMMLSGLFVIKHAALTHKVDAATLSRALIAVSDSVTFVDHVRFRGVSPTSIEGLHRLRERLVAVLLELMHLSILLAQACRQFDRALSTGKDPADIRSFLMTALDRAKIETMNYSSRPGTEEAAQKLLASLAAKLRECLK